MTSAARDDDCLFCKIAHGELDTQFVAESDNLVAFNDIAPHAPVHILIVPKAHLSSLTAITREHDALLGETVALAQQLAAERGVDGSGFRLLTNAGPDAGQTVFHLHWHLLGGKPLGPLG